MSSFQPIPISKRARLKQLRFPTEPSEDLAYFCGLMAGDGHIAMRESKADYYLTIEGNPADERELYSQIVCPLVKRLFNIDIQPQMFQHTYGIRIRSKALMEYLTTQLKLPKNRKYSQLTIPHWINYDNRFLINYVRGLADTDFCLCFKKRHKSVPYYPVIIGVSESKSYLEEIAKTLETFGFTVSRHYDYRYPDSRLKAGYYIHHRIYLYGYAQLKKWMGTIGFQSPKHLNKYEHWRDVTLTTLPALKPNAKRKEARGVPTRPQNSGGWI